MLLVGCRFDPAGVDDVAPTDADAAADAAARDAAPDPCASADVVACWRLEDPAMIRDDSVYGNHGTATGARSAAGVSGQALALDAASTIEVPDSASLDVLGPITIELWLRADQAPAAGGRAGIIDDNGQWGLFLSPEMQVRCAMGSSVAIGGAVAVGQWTHVACVYDRSTIQLFQDGVPGASIAYTAELPTAPADGVHLGEDSPDGDDQLIGAIDEVRVWRIERTAEELCASAGCAQARGSK